MLPQQPGGAYLKLIAGPHDAQEGFLLGRLEGPLLFEFVLQLRGLHGSIRAVRSPAYSLYVIYWQVKSLAGVFLRRAKGDISHWSGNRDMQDCGGRARGGLLCHIPRGASVV